ncbi:MAG: DMT family transporter [Chloroflexota bacterium]|nr:DMT family transporter [Chloroflexota bacterium]PLS83643.1 MAG: EamA/RhaT family transporter [Chloroflexota bacterium]
MASQRLGFVWALAAAFVWSFTAPGLSYLLDVYNVPRLTLAFWRDLFVVLAVLPAALIRFGLPRRHELVRFALAGVVFIGLYHGIWVFSVAYNGPAVAVVLIYTFPAFTTVGAWLLWREMPSRSAILGLVLAFVGCLLVVQAYKPELLVLNWLGIVCGIATGVLQAGYSLFTQRAVRNREPWTTLGWLMTFGTLALLLTQRPQTIWTVGTTPWPWLVVLGLALGPTLGGYVLYSLALRSLPAGVAGTIVTMEAPFAALLSAITVGQWLSWPQMLGLLLVLLGAVLPQSVSWLRAVAPAPSAACELHS